MNDRQRTLTRVSDLIAAGLAAPDAAPALERVGKRYAIAITPSLAALVDREQPDDPIARQFVPDVRELETHPAEIADPIGDHVKSPVAGIVHRYPDRALLKIASVCPVYCRFCFRREMVGPQNGDALTGQQLQDAIAYIAGHPEIWELILTGGDPLVLAPQRIREVTTALSDIAHVKVLRWHTRVPVVAPEKITADLIAALTATDRAVFIGLHVNHAQELGSDARRAIARLVDAGIPLVSQTVLLKGVNDDADALDALFRELVSLRVKPYYLHHGDLAPGTAHFRVPVARGQALMRELRQRLSGLAIPTYVLDLPGAHGKVPLETHMRAIDERSYEITDAHGVAHRYDDACVAADVP